jgi:hypothetical protein
VICFSPSLSDSFIFLTLTRLVVVLKFINFRFALFTPPLGDFHCFSLQPVQKKRQEDVKFTFNVGKCDKIFDELLKNGNIKINHTVPSADELKRRAYYKWHNSFSHATHDCNLSTDSIGH